MFGTGHKEECVEGIFLKKNQNGLKSNRTDIKHLISDSTVLGTREPTVEETDMIPFPMEFTVLEKGE